MKLQNLQEAKYDTEMNKFPNVVAAMKIGARIKKDFSLDKLAWICALDDTEYIGEADHDTVAALRYDPSPGFKGNPELVNDYLEFLDFENKEDGYDWLKQWIERS